MPNIIELNLLENKSIVATMQGYPLANENSYKIIAGEENATQFLIKSKPTEYENATYYVEMVNAKGGGIDKNAIEDDVFTLPKGMAVAGYGFISISCECDITSTTIKGAEITTDYTKISEAEKTYVFTFGSNGWEYNGNVVQLNTYGVVIENDLEITIKEGDKIIVTKEAKPVFQPLKVKVWNTIPQWQDYVDKTTNVKVVDGYLILTENGNEYNLGYVQGEKGIDGKDHSEEIAQLNEKLETYFISAKEQIDINSEEISKNSAKIHNLTNILLENEQMEVVKVSQAFTTRQTADGENISDNQNVFPKLIKGSTVKSTNLIPYPYSGVYNGYTYRGVTFTVDDDGIITAIGTSIGTFNAILRDYFPITAGQVFRFSSGQTTISLDCRLAFITYDSNKENPVYTYEYAGGTTLTIPEGKTYGRIVIVYGTGADLTNLVFKPMLNEGSTALPFRPYFSGLKNSYLQSIKSTGRNLFNKAAATMKSGLAISTGELYVSKTYFTSDFIPVKPNTVYKISTTNEPTWWGCCYDTNKKYIGVAKPNELNKTLLSIEGAVYLRFCEQEEVLDTLMLNEGNTALPFEPYVKDTFNLPETLELGEYDNCNLQTGELTRGTGYETSETAFTEEQIAGYQNAIVSVDGLSLAYQLETPTTTTLSIDKKYYKAWNGGSETQVQGETDNSADGAMCTLTNDYFVKVGGATNEQTE